MNALLLILFVVIQILDVITTHVAFGLGGEEAMPVGRFLFAKLGFWGASVLLKGAAIAVAVAVTLATSNAWLFTGLLDLAGAYVLVSNVSFVLAMRD